jgi:hypothetical protein
VIDGNLKKFESLHRYIWPPELDLMAHISGLILQDRWGNWNRERVQQRKPQPHLSLGNDARVTVAGRFALKPIDNDGAS